jgi:hypothetical protein
MRDIETPVNTRDAPCQCPVARPSLHEQAITGKFDFVCAADERDRLLPGLEKRGLFCLQKKRGDLAVRPFDRLFHVFSIVRAKR